MLIKAFLSIHIATVKLYSFIEFLTYSENFIEVIMNQIIAFNWLSFQRYTFLLETHVFIWSDLFIASCLFALTSCRLPAFHIPLNDLIDVNISSFVNSLHRTCSITLYLPTFF